MQSQLTKLLEPMIMVWLWCVGACVGSFLNVAVYRLPRRCLSVFKPTRSFCPLCRHGIRWHENIPLLSWVFLRARCASCKAPIPVRYPLVELVTMLLFGWLAWLDLSEGRFVTAEAWGVFVVHASFVSALLVCTLIDFEFRIIPDEIDVPGLLLMPVAVALFPALIDLPPHRPLPDVAGLAGSLHDTLGSAFGWWGLGAVVAPLGDLASLPITDPGLYRHVAAFSGSLFGAIAGAGFIFLLGETFSRLLGKEAMGFGDVKYLGMIGGLTGWQGVATTLVVGCLAGSVGGVAHMVWSGRSQILGSDLQKDLTPMSRMGLWITGARGPAESDAPVKIRPGTSFFARFATGDPYVPFGPFLSLGAFVAAFWPGFLPELASMWRR